MNMNSSGRITRNSPSIHWNASLQLQTNSTIWRTGDVYEDEITLPSGENVSFYRHASRAECIYLTSNLPIEFFNHQLLEVDTNSDESVRDFLKYGFPFSPFRQFPESHVYDYLRLYLRTFDMDLFASTYHGMKRTDSIEEMLEDRISKQEAIATISFLQRMVHAIHEAVRHNTPLDDVYLACLNNASTNDDVVFNNRVEGIPYMSIKNLTNAICNQIVATIKSETEWYECEYCGKIFKHQQGASNKGKPDKDARFCSRQPCKNQYMNKRRKSGGGK